MTTLVHGMRPIKSVIRYVPVEPARTNVASPDAAPRRVLHAVGALSESVLRFLLPAADALRQAGARQYVLALKDGADGESVRHRLPQSIAMTLVSDRPGMLRRGGAWLAAFRDIRAEGALDVVHVHGATALSLAATASDITAAKRLVYSPSGAWDRKASTHWHTKAPALLTSLFGAHALVMSFGNSTDRNDADLTLDRWVVLGPPLPQAFHLSSLPFAERPPLVLAAATGGLRRAAMAVAQLGVLAAHGTADAPVFQWSGKCSPAAACILAAAGVLIHADHDPSSCAARLAGAAAFVSPGPEDGYPWHVAEAMACGVPVVALDTPSHRRLVINGRTGFLCGKVEDMLAPLNTLTKRQDLRQRLGNAARLRVEEVLGREAFARRLMDAYGLVPAAPDGAAAQACETRVVRRS